jgi:TPR repeat protein
VNADTPGLDPFGEPADRGDPKRAVRRLLEEVASGNDDAMHNLGFCYDIGVGTKPNPAKAMLWYRRAYRKGSSPSANNIATMYRDQGKPRLAFAWYLRAVLLRDGNAMVEVAKCYLHGWGVRKDLATAAKFAQRALASEFICEADREQAAEILAGIPEGAR